MQLDVTMDELSQVSNAVLQYRQLFEPVIKNSQKIVLDWLLVDSIKFLSVLFKHLIQEPEFREVDFLDDDAFIAFEDVVRMFCPSFIIFRNPTCVCPVKWTARVVNVLRPEGDIVSFDLFVSVLAIVFHLGC